MSTNMARVTSQNQKFLLLGPTLTSHPRRSRSSYSYDRSEPDDKVGVELPRPDGTGAPKAKLFFHTLYSTEFNDIWGWSGVAHS